jgi:hypothetical protein
MNFNRVASASSRQIFVVVLLILPILLDANLGESRSSEGGRSLLSVLSYSSNPTDRYPLGRCRGDCDDDSQCKVGLICFQRNSNEAVPGCDGGKSDDSKTDYCIDPDDLNDGDDDDDDDDDDEDIIRNFRLKLYWDNYMWQEENFERKWCMECRNGSCDEGDKTYIYKCGRSTNQRYDFVFVNSDDALIRLKGQSLCLERASFDIYLRQCDKNKRAQQWFAKQGDFRGDRFEISPRGLTSYCVTQPHHPKEDEEVHLEKCTTARNDDTSYWVRY